MDKEIRATMAEAARATKEVTTPAPQASSTSIFQVVSSNAPGLSNPPHTKEELKQLAKVQAILDKAKVLQAERVSDRDSFCNAQSSQAMQAVQRPAQVYDQVTAGEEAKRRKAQAEKSKKELDHYARQGLTSIGTFDAYNCPRCDQDCPKGACRHHSQYLPTVENLELPDDHWVDPMATKFGASDLPALYESHQTQTKCGYPRCVTDWAHSLACCPQLNSRCPRCLARGHWVEPTKIDRPGKEHLCDKVEGLFHDFVVYANQGVLTRFSEKHADLGFWPCRYADTRVFLRRQGMTVLVNRDIRKIIQLIDTFEEGLVDNQLTSATMLKDYTPPAKSLKEMRELAEEAIYNGNFLGDESGFDIELTTTQCNNMYHSLAPSNYDMAKDAIKNPLKRRESVVESEVSEEHYREHESPNS
jgi:hypothetical protein